MTKDEALQLALKLFDKALPIIRQDAMMMADITRHAPLDPESQAVHDATEYASEQLLREIPAAIAAIRAALAQQPEPVTAPDFAPGWRWMTHPSVNNGEPVPVYLFEDDGERWYKIMRPDDAVEFGWDERDSAWKDVPAPPQRVPLTDGEVEAILSEFDVDTEAWKPLVRAVERAHGIAGDGNE